MYTIKILTTQNVEIDYEIASLGLRILSHLVDYLIFFAYYFLVSLLLGYLAKYDLIEKPDLIMFIAIIPLFFYDLLCEIFMNGQSMGKKLVKIKVVKLDGTSPTLISYFLRWSLRIFENVLTFGSFSAVTILINGKGQRLGDVAAGTAVISLRERTSFDETIFVDVHDNYEIQFNEVEKLSEDDIAVIKEVIDFAYKNPGGNNTPLIINRARLNIEKVMGTSSTLQDLEFLEVLLKDYNKYHGRL